MEMEMISKLCGFDPLELLETIEFPNDRFERLLRLSKEARMVVYSLYSGSNANFVEKDGY